MASDAMKKDLNRNQLILVGVLFAVLLVIVYLFFLRGGGDTSSDLGSPPTTSGVVPSPTPVETVEPDEFQEDETENPEIFTRRDPFEPVIDLTGGAAGPVGTILEGDTAPSDSTATPAPGQTIAPGTDPTASPPPSTQGIEVKLVDVFGQPKRAQVRVEGTVYIVDEGETFADNFRLLSIAGKCASILFGDEQFSLCEGETVYK